MVLGELDRMGEAAAEALLVALDPARNQRCRDRYVGLPLDLRGVLFVAVATDPAALRRCCGRGGDDGAGGRIHRCGEAAHRDYLLVPHQPGQHGLCAAELSFSSIAIQLLIGGYSLEPGVRRLDADIDALCRRASRLRAEGLPVPGEMKPETLAAWLGAPRFRGGELAARTLRPGAALSLAATDDGGAEVLVVEAACLPAAGRSRSPGPSGR